ncbi:Murein DD-endopeptidase MepM [compost metagenome]
MNNAYIESIKKVLAGDVEVAKLSKDSIIAAEQADISEIDFKPSKEDAALREKVAQEDKYNLFDKAQAKVNLVLFPPVTGHITDKYDPKTKHFAVDIALPKNTPIKSVANGTVIFADWTPSTGYVIIIRHGEGIMSVYKHAASLTKTQGDIVRTGEVIAMAGSTGQESTGVHLHFELWKDGFAIDPTNFIEFE